MVLSFPPLTLALEAQGYFTMSAQNIIIMLATLALAHIHIFGTAQNPEGKTLCH